MDLKRPIIKLFALKFSQSESFNLVVQVNIENKDKDPNEAIIKYSVVAVGWLVSKREWAI